MQTPSVEKQKLLVIDDEDFAPARLTDIFAGSFEIIPAKSASEAMRFLQEDTFAVIVLDVNLPDISGIQLLKIVRDRYPQTPVVMLTGDGDYRLVVAAMQAGAAEFVVKSVENFDEEMRVRLTQALRSQELLDQNRGLVTKLEEHVSKYEIVGHSGAILSLRSEIIQVRPTQTTVLISGESGVGKELVARALNNQDPNKARPFIAVNCGALPENLIESELFGHEKGSFTHAIQSRKGKFLAANSGDIFLDEIGEMPLHMQIKLLRVLQDRAVTPVGSEKSIPLNIRVIAGTNKNLGDEVRAGRFREDLFYRLAVVEIEVPPLRERIEDIPVLAEHFLKSFGAGHISLSKAARSLLERHSWPGNIRALKNCIEGALIKCRAADKVVIEPDMIRLLDVAFKTSSEVDSIPHLPRSQADLSPERYRDHMGWAEKNYLKAAYVLTRRKKTLLADLLGLNRNTVRERLLALGIEDPEPSSQIK